MSQATLKTLQQEVELKQRQLNLVLAIDHIRDTTLDPAAMFAAIVNTLTDHMQVELCLLALLDRETGQIELKAINDRSHEQGKLEQFFSRELAEKAVHSEGITIWSREMLAQHLSSVPLPEISQVATVPIVMGDHKRLGALLLARLETAFSPTELKLLETAESMVDSAIIQGYADHTLRQHIKELETIYRIDHIRDQHLSFDEMLNAVLQEICQVIQGEVAFTMLYDRAGQALELRATTQHDLFKISSNYQTINRLAHTSLRQTNLVYENNLEGPIRSLMCLPLILNNEIIGVLGVANHHQAQGFSAEDRRLLRAIGSQIDTAIFESLERRRLREVLGRSVDPRVMERLLANHSTDFLKGERAVLSVLYGDLRGSTLLAEETDPELLVGFVNHYLGQMTDIILGREGTLDKFVGDEVMALFGAPFPQADHALRAVRVGLEMQQAHQTVMQIWQERGIKPAPMGIGIATGELIVGEMGCPQRADYTVIGRAANLGARICSAAKAGEVLISQETYELVQDKVEATPIMGLQFKGVNRDVVVYRVNRVLDE
jgi:class 3 adenylate cyclase/GTP-sensing pleiotropic transcriptional regulator CodY